VGTGAASKPFDELAVTAHRRKWWDALWTRSRLFPGTFPKATT
jgi:hypothetical protein